MTDIFVRVLEMSLTASVVIAVIILLRLILRKAPKVFSYVLWAAALFRLLCPVSFELPSAPIPQVEIPYSASEPGEVIVLQIIPAQTDIIIQPNYQPQTSYQQTTETEIIPSEGEPKVNLKR